jgi:hypothetical protein
MLGNALADPASAENSKCVLDIHDEKLGTSPAGKSDSLQRCEEIKGELVMILGVNDTHVVRSIDVMLAK